MNLDRILHRELAELEQAHLRRVLRVRNGTSLLNFASNDYLGLSQHPQLIAAACSAIEQHGTGAGAARLVSGTSHEVLALEASLARWKETAAALIFGSGYAAALGAIPALVGKNDIVILDKLVHASLIDGAKLSGAQIRVFPHNHLELLEKILKVSAPAGARRLIITESIFSMDGDAAHLAEIVALKERYGAWLLVDEAHATGLYGSTGAGLVSALGLSDQVEIILGTLSKALGGVGGYIAGSQVLIDLLVNRARSFVYSTALPPGVIAANAAAIDLAQGKVGQERRAALWRNLEQFCAKVPASFAQAEAIKSVVPVSRRAIQPLLCGETTVALELAKRLEQQGFFIPAIRYPTVPRARARLRLTLNALRTQEEIKALLDILHFTSQS